MYKRRGCTRIVVSVCVCMDTVEMLLDTKPVKVNRPRVKMHTA